MSYQDLIIIGTGVTSSNLVMGPEASGGSALTVQVENGGTLDGINQVLTGGALIVSNGGAASGVYMNTADGNTTHSGISIDGGTLEGGSACGNGTYGALGVVRSGGVLSNFTLTTQDATGNNWTWFWVGRAAGDGAGTAKNVTVEKRARFQVQLTGKAYDTTVQSGGIMYLFNTATAEDTVVSGAYLGNKATLHVGGNNALTRVRVGSDGVLNLTYGASVTDLVTEAGATVDLSSNGNTSGAMLRGSNTAITEGTLRYNGTLLNGAAAAGVLSGVSGAAAWRFSIGEGLTVENAKLTSGVRIYAHENAIVSSSVILTSGNISLIDNAVGREVTVGGEGETAANYNVFNNGSAYETVVSNGGFLRVRNEGSVASGATVYAGGSAVGYDGLMNEIHVEDGGHLHVSAGATATNVWLNAVTATDATNFSLLIEGGTVEGGSACGSSGKWAMTGVVCSGGVLSNFTLTTRQYSTALPTWFWIGKTNGDGGGLAKDITVERGARLQVQKDGVASGVNLNNSELLIINGGKAISVTAVNGTIITLNNGAFLEDADLTNCKITVNAGATARDITITTPQSAPVISAGANVDGLEIVSGTLTVDVGVTVKNLTMKTQATGTNSLIVNGTVIGGSGVGLGGVTNAFRFAVSSGGVLSNFTLADGTADYQARGWVYTGGTARDIVIGSNGYIQVQDAGAAASGAVIMSGGTAVAWRGGTMYDTVVGGELQIDANGSVYGGEVRSGGSVLVTKSGGCISGFEIFSGGSVKFGNDYATGGNIVVHSGGVVSTYTNGTITDLTVSAGGRWICDWNAYAQRITGTVTLDLTGARGVDTALVERHFNGLAASRVVKASEEIGNYEYKLIASGGANANAFTLDIGGGNSYATDNTTADIIDPLTKMSYSRQVDGGALKLVTTVDPSRQIAAVDSAAALATSGSTLNGSDREARWTANTTYGDTVYAAQGMTTGNAWLEIDGATVGTALYGAAAGQNFTGAVNMKLTSGSIRNLAAGAANGGTVANVNFTMAGGTLAGAAYAGGFGNVTETIKTTITDGTLAEGKDFYAGALANYAKTNTATSVGNISLTIVGGTFGGNIYGASAVKASVANAHTAGNVTLSITGGETAKGDQACIFAGGYATGSATTTKVYTVGDIDATVSGGSWGEAGNGRGFFGGAFASGVTAEAQDVTITIDGGSIGNVFGGGWAQKGGTSIVDDVEIVITGGTVTNVFGGGAHSTSGGATTVDDVEITISGGSITGSIYAMGQSDGDAVVGDEVSVTFTGANDFGCNVYGYSYVGGEVNDATLSYTDYTGTFSGEIGGFASVTLNGGTAMTLATDADNVSNGAWEFDFTDRASLLAGTSLLTWSTANFENDTIKVSFADETQAKAGWNIATVAEAFSGTTFDLTVGETEITGLAYNQQIASGDYAGWGFDLESGVLKFKQLA